MPTDAPAIEKNQPSIPPEVKQPVIFQPFAQTDEEIDQEVTNLNKLMGKPEDEDKPAPLIPQIPKASKAIGEEIAKATPGLIEQPVNPVPEIIPIEQPSPKTVSEVSPAPRITEALQAAATELNNPPIKYANNPVRDAVLRSKAEEGAETARMAKQAQALKTAQSSTGIIRGLISNFLRKKAA